MAVARVAKVSRTLESCCFVDELLVLPWVSETTTTTATTEINKQVYNQEPLFLWPIVAVTLVFFVT